MFWRNLLLLIFLGIGQVRASYLLIPMDQTQKNHLKAYGIAYWSIKGGLEVDWLLNYKGGSFALKYAKAVEAECNIRGVTIQILPDAQYSALLQ